MSFARTLVFACVAMWMCCIAVSVPASAQAPTAAAMSNGDVVKLVKLGFDISVVEAKITQAPSVRFKVDVDGLSQLKAAGVPQSVIAIMLKRSTAGVAAPGIRPPFNAGSQPAPGFVGVAMVTHDDQRVNLQSVGGVMHNRGYIISRVSETFPGARADARTRDQQPVFDLAMPMSPRGNVKLVMLQPEPRANERSLKLGRINGFTGSGGMNFGNPDASVEVAFDLAEADGGGWRLTPKQPLSAGEYGVLLLGQLFDFAVDP